MKTVKLGILQILVGFSLSFGLSSQINASETDQFSLPEIKLEDSGLDMESMIRQDLAQAIEETNNEIHRLSRKLKENETRPNFEKKRRRLQKRIEALLGSNHIAQVLYDKNGTGLVETKLENYFSKSSLKSINFRHRVLVSQSIYRKAFLVRAPLFYWFSPNVNMFGYVFGTDKIGHFFQQGFHYFKMYEWAKSYYELSPEKAKKFAASYYAYTETYFWGGLTTGVYSNADLASNYAGFKFYLNLTQAVQIGNQLLEPLLIKFKDKQGVQIWKLNPLRRFVFKPFVSLHWNEAFNPSQYNSLMIEAVVSEIKSRCELWKLKKPSLNHESLLKTHNELKTWFGEDYGHKGNFENTPLLSEICF